MIQPQAIPRCFVAAACVLLVVASTCHAAEPSLKGARRLLMTGNYAEALESYDSLMHAEPVPAVLGKARVLAATGDDPKALDLLSTVAAAHPKAAELRAEQAELEFHRGNYDTAQVHVDAALTLHTDQLVARWIAAELHRTAGRMEQANEAYRWFIDYYNRRERIDDSDALLYVGRAAAQYARWNRLSDQFSFLVNDLYPESLELEAEFWPACYEAGLLFLEKYNTPEATRQFKAALALNPRAAEVHAALAALALQSFDVAKAKSHLQQARESNPNLIDAHLLEGDLHLINFQASNAIEAINAALKLNPKCEHALGRLAAAYAVRYGTTKEGTSPAIEKLITQVEQNNPHAGEFYTALAGGLELVRKYPDAGRFYETAIQRMPQLTTAHGNLGMIYMRLGQEVEAEKLLQKAFEIDPFNVRVRNTLQVLDVLAGYAVIATEHFVLKFDRGQDEVLAQHMARYLEEEVYSEVCLRMGYEPQGKTLLEVFNRAKNTSGHGWFSARMVGLPSIGTVGGCAGKMFAMASPASLEQKFNWARVLTHEFVHVVNLQQTDFNVPHWYTEGLAVVTENTARPAEWNDILARRAADDELFNLETINFGFVRPGSGDDWQLAYCQAALYTDYLEELGGPDVHKRMLAAYAQSPDTKRALRQILGISQEDFEAGYDARIKTIVERIKTRRPAEDKDIVELEREHQTNPDDQTLAARLAKAYLSRKAFAKARELSEQVLESEPKQPLAVWVLARLYVQDGDDAKAVELLENSLDGNRPDLDIMTLLAGLKFKQGDLIEAARLYEAGSRLAPHDRKWPEALSLVHLNAKNEAGLMAALARVAEMDPDDLVVRKKLVELAGKLDDHQSIARWAREGLQIDVLDQQLHRDLAEAEVNLGNFDTAAREYETILKLSPDDSAARMSLANVFAESGQGVEAAKTIRELLRKEPDFPGAKQLLEAVER